MLSERAARWKAPTPARSPILATSRPTTVATGVDRRLPRGRDSAPRATPHRPGRRWLSPATQPGGPVSRPLGGVCDLIDAHTEMVDRCRASRL